ENEDVAHGGEGDIDESRRKDQCWDEHPTGEVEGSWIRSHIGTEWIRSGSRRIRSGKVHRTKASNFARAAIDIRRMPGGASQDTRSPQRRPSTAREMSSVTGSRSPFSS